MLNTDPPSKKHPTIVDCVGLYYYNNDKIMSPVIGIFDKDKDMMCISKLQYMYHQRYGTTYKYLEIKVSMKIQLK